jgi:hypothetical protein
VRGALRTLFFGFRNQARSPLMSMSHKAFAFRWADFQRELAPILLSALTDTQPQALIDFANANFEALFNPYTAEPLKDDWREQLEVGDVQELGDFVLTKYYDPSEDAGLGDQWMRLEAHLGGTGKVALLGNPFGPAGKYFDPGRMGSYFQDEATVRRSLEELQTLGTGGGIDGFIQLLGRSVAEMKGIYVTF